MSEWKQWALVIIVALSLGLGAGIFVEQKNASCDPEFTKNAVALCTKNWTDEHNKTKFLDGIDTNGVSCSQVVDHMNAKYVQELRTYELNARMLETKYSALKDVAVKYFQLTQDSTVIPLIRE